MKIILMLNFGRSGGTLLNQCLGALPNTVIMSEVHRLGGGWGAEKESSLITVKNQALAWYNISLKSDNHIDAILELADHCEKNDLDLIIRDWVYVSFAKDKVNKNQPAGRLETYEALKSHIEVVPFVFVRDSIDMWISWGCKNPKQMYEGYHPFLKAVLNEGFPVFKYEDFCLDPHTEMEKMCKTLGLTYDPSFTEKYPYINANGNTQSGNSSRGIKIKKIRLLPRKIIPRQNISLINESEEMHICNTLTGYPTNYFNKDLSALQYLYSSLKMRITQALPI